jgi:ABC-type branched-subunit amino acid transport system permease subunit
LVVFVVGAAPAGVAGVLGAGNNVVVVAGGPADVAIGRDPAVVGVATVVEGGGGRGVAAVVVGTVLGTVVETVWRGSRMSPSSIETEGAGEGRTVVGMRIVFVVVDELGEESVPPP